MNHSVTHHIVTSVPAMFSNPRRLSPENLKIPKTEFDVNTTDSMQSSANESSSPLRLPDKGNQEWRPCSDYRRLSGIATDERSPITLTLDRTHRLQGKINL